MSASDAWQRIYAVVRRVPKGRVATYGQVASLAGCRGQARLVGYALHAVPPASAVPWHRIINARGLISLRREDSASGATQRILLERERVRFDAAGRVDLKRYVWRPRAGGVASSNKARRRVKAA